MKKLIYSITVRDIIIKVFILLCIASNITMKAQDGASLVILHTNDLHSRLEGYAPSSEYTPLTCCDDSTIGGFSRLASIIKNVRSENTGKTLVLDAGDFLMGTFFHYMEEYKPFQLNLMKEMGYDAAALGNHEFDFGPERLADIIANSEKNGPIPQLLLSNAEFDESDSSDDKIQDLFNDGIISPTVIIEKNGLKIGLFSLLGEDADHSAPYAEPISFKKITRVARKTVKELEDMNVDIIICLSHSGIAMGEDGEWQGEDIDLARKVKGIDIIISGHTHTRLDKPLIIDKTILVQAYSYGSHIGSLEIKHTNENIELVNYDLIPVDDNMTGNKSIQDKINKQKELISEKLYRLTGYKLEDRVVETAFKLECDEYGNLTGSNLGPLVADAIHDFIDENTDEGTDISMVAAGVIRDNIEPGIQTSQDIFRVMSLGSGKDDVPGYALAKVYVNARELKRIIEVLLFAYKSSPSNYCYYSGLEVKYDPDKGMLRKVKSISIQDDSGKLVPVEVSGKNERLYSIAANSYMLEFIGIIQKMTFGLVKVKPKDSSGNEIKDFSNTIIDFDTGKSGIQEGKEWIALLSYLMSMKDSDNDGIPDMKEAYREPDLRVIPVEQD